MPAPARAGWYGAAQVGAGTNTIPSTGANDLQKQNSRNETGASVGGIGLKRRGNSIPPSAIPAHECRDEPLPSLKPGKI